MRFLRFLQHPADGDEFLIHLVLVMQEPRAFLGLRHIGQDEDRVIERVLAEIGLDTAVGGQCLVFQAFIVDELGFINKQPREGEGFRKRWDKTVSDC